MKKTISLFICLVIGLLSITALAETAAERIVTVNLDTATDEELVSVIEAVVAEQKARIKTTLTLDQTNITVAKGKKEKVAATVADIKDGVKLTKTVWTSSDEKIAKVANGVISGVGGGKAKITCTALFSDGFELAAECDVTVIVAATGLTVSEKNITLGIGKVKKIVADIKPADVSVKKLKYVSADPNIISVDENGTMKAEHGGRTTVTVSTTDGSEKSAVVTVYVPSVFASKTEHKITSKNGGSITVDYYGTRSNLNVAVSGKAGTVTHSLSGNTLTLNVRPNTYGNLTITVSDKSDSKSKVTLKVTVEHSAVYDKVSYPNISYDGAARYPSSYKGDKVSFSGKVLQVISGYGETCYRISSRGRWDNVVYVTIKSSNIGVPVIEDDSVTVYGTYDGNYTYKSIMGASITIPSVIAEKIDVR